MSNKMKKTALDRKLDKIRAAEESGKLGTKLTNRTLRKLTSNKLAVIGVLLFLVICILCFGAPMFTKHDPMMFDLRAKMAAPSAEHILATYRWHDLHDRCARPLPSKRTRRDLWRDIPAPHEPSGRTQPLRNHRS